MDLIDRQTAIDTFHAYAPGIPWDKLDMIFAEIPSVQASGDLIDRQAAIESIKNDPVGRVIAERYNIIGWLEGLPSAQPERKKGKWIELDYTQAWEYKCDQCGRLSDFKENFCPNCGADMRGE